MSMRMKRLPLVPQDAGCCPVLIGQLTESCMGVLPDDLNREMSQNDGRFQTVPAFWTAMLYSLGWQVPAGLIEKFPDDVREAACDCEVLRRQLLRKSPLNPAKALIGFLEHAAEGYGNAAKRWGVNVTVAPPANYKPRDTTFDAVCVTYSSFLFAEPRTCKIGYARLTGKVEMRRQQNVVLDRAKVFVVEITSPVKPMRLPQPESFLLSTRRPAYA
jgi:hypothetical protein